MSEVEKTAHSQEIRSTDALASVPGSARTRQLHAEWGVVIKADPFIERVARVEAGQRYNYARTACYVVDLAESNPTYAWVLADYRTFRRYSTYVFVQMYNAPYKTYPSLASTPITDAHLFISELLDEALRLDT